VGKFKMSPFEITNEEIQRIIRESLKCVRIILQKISTKQMTIISAIFTTFLALYMILCEILQKAQFLYNKVMNFAKSTFSNKKTSQI